jgi:hypothetical protein
MVKTPWKPSSKLVSQVLGSARSTLALICPSLPLLHNWVKSRKSLEEKEGVQDPLVEVHKDNTDPEKIHE